MTWNPLNDCHTCTRSHSAPCGCPHFSYPMILLLDTHGNPPRTPRSPYRPRRLSRSSTSPVSNSAARFDGGQSPLPHGRLARASTVSVVLEQAARLSLPLVLQGKPLTLGMQDSSSHVASSNPTLAAPPTTHPPAARRTRDGAASCTNRDARDPGPGLYNLRHSLDLSRFPPLPSPCPPFTMVCTPLHYLAGPSHTPLDERTRGSAKTSERLARSACRARRAADVARTAPVFSRTPHLVLLVNTSLPILPTTLHPP